MKRKLVSGLLSLLLLLSFYPANRSYAETSSIPDGAKEYNGNYYYFYVQSSYWDDAKINREAVGGRLVTFI